MEIDKTGKITLLGGNILLYAGKPKPNRFYLTSEQHLFGSFETKFLLVDSGCSSTLLPINEGELVKVLECFPPVLYKWIVSTGSGVSSVQSPIILISPTKDNKEKKIRVELCRDIGPFVCNIDFIRFHLCLDYVKTLISWNSEGKLDMGNSSIEVNHKNVYFDS